MANKTKRKVGVLCLDCGTRLFSWSVHDFRYCDCKGVYIDGGNEYIRIGGSLRYKTVYATKKELKEMGILCGGPTDELVSPRRGNNGPKARRPIM